MKFRRRPHGVAVEVGRWRCRLFLGWFRSGWDRQGPRAGALSFGPVLVTYLQTFAHADRLTRDPIPPASYWYESDAERAARTS